MCVCKAPVSLRQKRVLVTNDGATNRRTPSRQKGTTIFFSAVAQQRFVLVRDHKPYQGEK